MSETECPVCLLPEKEWEGSTKAPCGHSMCMQCFLSWNRLGKPNCPLCRGSFASDRPIVSFPWYTTYVNDALSLLRNWHLPSLPLLPSLPSLLSLPTLAFEQYTTQRRRQERRKTFLSNAKEEFRAHCLTCTDAICLSSHSRHLKWLERGNLVPCPSRLSSLPRETLGLLFRQNSISRDKKKTLLAESARLGEPLNMRRLKGLKEAVTRQQNKALELNEARRKTEGSVVKRTKLPLSNYVKTVFAAGQRQSPGIKTFKGYTPPKHGARIGDVWESNGIKGICTGYNLWTLSDGTKTVLKTNKWISLQ